MRTMGSIALFGILLVGAQAHAGTLFKVEPGTEEQKAIGKVFETLAAKQATRDARGVLDLLAEDAVSKYFFGQEREPREAKGKQAIYILLSNPNVQKVEYYDLVIKKIEGSEAEVTGRATSYISAVAMNFIRDAEMVWRLRREGDTWRIYHSEQINSVQRRT